MVEAGPTEQYPGRAAALLFAGVIAGAALTGSALWLGISRFAAPAPAAAGPPHLVEEALAAGIDHVYDGEFTFFVGGGVAAFDCDADGLEDLYFAGGSNSAALYRNESTPGGELRFSRLADPVTDLVDVTGAYPIDIDSDSITDLVVLRFGENVLLRGQGDCRFERSNENWSFDGGDDWTAAFSATWEGAAELPTLAFGNYVLLDQSGRRTGECSDNYLYRPAAGGYPAATELTPGWCTLSILFSDWDRTGERDLRMTNDRHYYIDGEEQLWRIVAGARPQLYSTGDGWQTMQIWGMGIASQDLTGDGRPEVFLTSQGDNKLQTLTDAGGGAPTYTDIAFQRGVTAHRPFTPDAVFPSTAWHPEFGDVNNDGLVDLYISKGNVDAEEGFAVDDPSDLLLGQPDGTFVEAAPDAGMISPGRSRGAALVDLNLDGLLDIVEVNRRENVKVWRNLGVGGSSDSSPEGNWIAVDLSEAAPNVDAIGAWISVRAGSVLIEREVTVGGGHAGGQLGWLHFGIGAAAEAEVRVQWPDGTESSWIRAEANRFFTIVRDRADAVEWRPSALR